ARSGRCRARRTRSGKSRAHAAIFKKNPSPLQARGTPLYWNSLRAILIEVDRPLGIHEENVMTETTRLKSLKIALILVGVIFIVGIYPLGLTWPSGWLWHTGYSDYHLMIVGVYATLGIFLIAAARDPLANRSLIQFTIWSSIVHALIMM